MYVDEILALVRLAEANQAVVSSLARTILSLVEELRDAHLRADLAEASLDVESGRLQDLRDELARWDSGSAADASGLLEALTNLLDR